MEEKLKNLDFNLSVVQEDLVSTVLEGLEV